MKGLVTFEELTDGEEIVAIARYENRMIVATKHNLYEIKGDVLRIIGFTYEPPK